MPFRTLRCAAALNFSPFFKFLARVVVYSLEDQSFPRFFMAQAKLLDACFVRYRQILQLSFMPHKKKSITSVWNLQNVPAITIHDCHSWPRLWTRVDSATLWKWSGWPGRGFIFSCMLNEQTVLPVENWYFHIQLSSILWVELYAEPLAGYLNFPTGNASLLASNYLAAYCLQSR